MTQGERGMLWYDESGAGRTLPALPVPAARVRDTSGAGDVFHGAYVYSYLGEPSAKAGRSTSGFARHAAAFKIQHLGNEAGLPTLDDIEAGCARVRSGRGVEPRPARASAAAMRRSR